MQAVILAAGRGTRMGELTESAPKVLLEVAGKTLLEHKFDILPNDVDEIILVVGYFGSTIQNHFGGIYKDKKIFYVEQEKLDGTAGALWRARTILRDQFLVMYGDDIYSKEDMMRVSASRGWALCALEVEKLGTAAKIIVDARGKVTEIKECEEHDGGAGYLNTGLYLLDVRIFDQEMVPKSEDSEEFGLPQTMVRADVPIHLIPATFWLQITSPDDLQKAEEILTQMGQ